MLGKIVPQKPLEFFVEKAREFESFKQIPRYSKPSMAVIHPSPEKVRKEPSHKPPKTLLFDGSPYALSKRPDTAKNLPDHLVRPAIDEEKLFKIREREALKARESKDATSKKKVSLED